MNAVTVGPHISDRAAWIAAHEGRTGSGDAAVLVLGKVHGRTPMTLFTQALGLAERENLDDVEAIQLGTELEPAVAARFAKETGRHVESHGTLLFGAHPRTCCTIDFLQWRPETPATVDDGVLETKTTGSVAHIDAAGEMPRAWWIQLQHQLFVTGLKWGSLAVLGGAPGGLAFRRADFERDDAFIGDVLVPAIETFWRCVETREPPPPDSTTEYGRALAKLWPKDSGAVVAMSGEFIDLDAELSRLKSEIAEREDRVTTIENQIRAAIGEATTGMLPNGVAWAWKAQRREAHTVKASEFRVLRRKEASNG